MNAGENKRRLAGFRYDHPMGAGAGRRFNDGDDLVNAGKKNLWPTSITVYMDKYTNEIRRPVGLTGASSDNLVQLVRCVMVKYDGEYLRTHGTIPPTESVPDMQLDIPAGVKVVLVKMQLSKVQWWANLCIDYMGFKLSNGTEKAVGVLDGAELLIQFVPPKSTTGLKGFYGACASMVDSIGVIWG